MFHYPIYTKKAPKPGFYNQGVSVDPACHMLYLSGQTGNIPGVEGEPVVEGGVFEQTTQALENLLAIVEKADGDISSFVKLSVFLKDSPTSEGRKESRLAMGDAYEIFFQKHGLSRRDLPARTMLWVSEVPYEAPTENTLVAIDGIAAIYPLP